MVHPAGHDNALDLDALTLQDGVLFHSQKGKPRPVDLPALPVADTHGHLSVLETRSPGMAIARAAAAGVCLLVVPLDPIYDNPVAAHQLAEFGQWQEDGEREIAHLAQAGIPMPSFDVPGVGGQDRAHADLLARNLRFVAGAHPYGAARFDDAARDWMRQMIADPRCAGIGEIGLDYTCDVPRDAQIAAFEEQLALALACDLPVELHIRDERDDAQTRAHADALDVLRRIGVPPRGCDLHCFTQDPQVALPFADMGCHVAFGGAVTFKKSDDIRAAAAAVPRHLLLSETDCPYMAPVPLRGMECEPAMAVLSAQLVAAEREHALGEDPACVLRTLWDNALLLFGN